MASGSFTRFNTRNNTTSRAGQFTEKTSLELDPPNANRTASTVQKVDEVILDPAVNANSMRPGDPTGRPVVSGALGKAAVGTIAGAVGLEAIFGNNNVSSSTPTNNNNFVPQDNTAVRIVIMEPSKNQ